MMPEIETIDKYEIGVNIIKDWLIRNGFKNISQVEDGGGKADITAKGRFEFIIVFVKTNVYPINEFSLSEEEIARFKEKAIRYGRMAYVASLVIDQEDKPVGEISWIRLS
jgi:hypothetical protein